MSAGGPITQPKRGISDRLFWVAICLILFVFAIFFMVMITSQSEAHSPLVTIEHDGHRFIMNRHGRERVLTHHPDCGCGKGK